MSRDEMHAFERASMEDPFLSDALEGYMQADMAVADEHLSNISDRVHQKETKREQAVVVAMPKKGFAMWRVAAMVIIIAGAGLITYNVLDKEKIDTGTTGPIAKVEPNETKPIEVPQNSVPATQGSSSENTGEGKIKENIGDKGSVTSSVDAVKPEQKQSSAAIKANDLKEQDAREITVRKTEKDNNVAVLEEIRPASPVRYDTNEVLNKIRRERAVEISGNIVTPNNTPLANTRFRVDNQKNSFSTDNQGNFTFVAPDSVVNATITSGEYAKARVQLRANTTTSLNMGTITMKPDEEFEKTVAVVGLGSKKTNITDTSDNKPVGGWSSFQDYVTKKMGITAEAADSLELFNNSTTVEFVVDAKGVPKNIKVINTTDAAKAKQIIEAIRKGPKWATTNKTTRILIKY
jgi:hypothetical protein